MKCPFSGMCEAEHSCCSADGLEIRCQNESACPKYQEWKRIEEMKKFKKGDNGMKFITGLFLFLLIMILTSCKGLDVKETEYIKEVLVSETKEPIEGTDLHKAGRQAKLKQAIDICEESLK